ncbi:uncharacterized protein LOC126886443 isoform X2 [Diabrotica virgifera virgifera]|uniref:Serine/threonine-protein phosphatase n=2 Tax=Diabrotica virgifera virgifera TaxID=50390 RepID=A0ABM5KGL3_DIAVI|nr:uncharacterized protein LOC126886443 isoform X2 [Diabrotica virgifera virgifera]
MALYFKTPSELCDVVSVVAFCSFDSTMLLIVDNIEHWIPGARVLQGMSWEKTIRKEINEIFGPITSADLKILRTSKLYITRHTAPYLLHIVFQLFVDTPTKNKAKNTIGKYRGKCRWVSQSDILKLLQMHNLRSPELVELFYLIKKEQLPNSYNSPEDIIIMDTLLETGEDMLVIGKGTNFAQLVDAANIDRLGQEMILKEFVLMTFPAAYLNIRSFTRAVIDLGWEKPNANSLFRYYDRDNDKLLKIDDFKGLIADLRKARKNPIDAASVAKEASETYKAMGISEGSAINEADFMKAILELKIRGMPTVFRSSIGILKYIQQKANGGTFMPAVSAALPSNGGNLEGIRSKMEQLSSPMIRNSKDYEIAVHAVKIQRSGQALNIDEMRAIQDAVSTTTLKQPLNEQTRRISMDIFSQRSVSNELLKSLRYLTSINKIKDTTSSFTWGQLDSAMVARNLISICNQVREVFRTEPRLLNLRSPVYIMGDFHGNINDLLYFEKVLWHIGPGLTPSSLLFLGDYVDRGAFSFEVIAYLFSYKLQSPNKVNLLRGNHEIREVQKMFTFYKECCLKFGEKLGNEVWIASNNAFDTMPIAATIDGKVFCCHGGVPPPWLCPVITAINDIPVPLNQPDVQSSLAWELMWNDPVRPKALNDKLAMELLANEGFAVNTRRGTAHVFSVEALERFLKANQLTHFVRAHEVAQAGFQVNQKGKLLTVFSSSKYCGGKNDAACIMADAGKLRVLRLDTT